jgi:hypothetical protein
VDATDGSALVASAAISGQTYVLGGKGRFEVIITGVDDSTDGSGPLGPHYALEGLQYRVSYGQTNCDFLA